MAALKQFARTAELYETQSPHAASLRTNRKHELKAFITALLEKNVGELVFSDDALFVAVLDLATADYGVEQKKIAEHLGLSPTAITRWRQGESLPKPYARKAVILTISALIESRLSAIDTVAAP